MSDTAVSGYLAKLKSDIFSHEDFENASYMFGAMNATDIKVMKHIGVISFQATPDVAASIKSLPTVQSVEADLQVQVPSLEHLL